MKRILLALSLLSSVARADFTVNGNALRLSAQTGGVPSQCASASQCAWYDGNTTALKLRMPDGVDPFLFTADHAFALADGSSALGRNGLLMLRNHAGALETNFNNTGWQAVAGAITVNDPFTGDGSSGSPLALTIDATLIVAASALGIDLTHSNNWTGAISASTAADNTDMLKLTQTGGGIKGSALIQYTDGPGNLLHEGIFRVDGKQQWGLRLGASTYYLKVRLEDGYVTIPAAGLSLNSHQINDVANGTSAQDAVTVSQLTAAIAGAGTVTSIATTPPLAGGTITSTGTLSLNIGAGLSTSAGNLVIATGGVTNSMLATLPTLQNAYANGSTGGGIINLNSTGAGLILRDNVTPLGTPLFQVTDSGGTNVFFEVDASTSGNTVLTLGNGHSAANSATGFGNFAYDNTAHKFTGSENAANYDPFVQESLSATLANKTLTTPVINGATSASGNFDLSGSSGTWKPPTGGLAAALVFSADNADAIGTTSVRASNVVAKLHTAYFTTGDAISTTVTNGLDLTNALVATVGVQSYSPATHRQGSGWKTTATAAAQTVEMIDFLRPVQGTANPTMQWVFQSNLNGGGAVEFLDIEPADYTNGGFKMTGVGNATVTLTGSATMGGTGVAFKMNSANSLSASDKILSVLGNTTEYFRVGQEAGGSAETSVIGNFGNSNNSGPFFIRSLSGSNGSALTFDATAQTNGRKMSWIGLGNASGGAVAAGDLVMYDNTAGHYRMAIKSSGAVLGYSTSIATSGWTDPGSALSILRDAIASAQTLTASVGNPTLSTSGAAVQSSGCFELQGHVWNTTATAADNFASVCMEMMPTSANSPTTELQLYKSVAATNTRSFSKFMAFNDAGHISYYNGEATAGNGVGYIEKVGSDVASSGAGAQTTQISTFSVGTTGLYRVSTVCSATTADTVSTSLTYTDAINTTAQTLNQLSSVSIGTNSTASATTVIRANTSTAIVVNISNSGQSTTKCSAVTQRLN